MPAVFLCRLAPVGCRQISLFSGRHPEARAFTSGLRDPARVKSAASAPDPSLRLKNGSAQDDTMEEDVQSSN